MGCEQDDEPPAETAGSADGDPRVIDQALQPWLPATRPKVQLETLSILTWPTGVAVDSPAFDHFLAAVVSPFCATYPARSTQLLYRRSLTYFFRWWGQARAREGQPDSFTEQLLHQALFKALFGGNQCCLLYTSVLDAAWGCLNQQ